MPVSNSSEWKMRRLKTVAAVMPSSVDKLSDPDDPPVRLCNYVDVYKNDLITGDMDFMSATATKAQIERFSLCAGDVLITKDSETPADIAVPAHVEESAAGVVCGYHLALLRPNFRQTHGKFLFWALRSAPVSASFTVRAQGITRFGLTVNAMGDVLIPLPSVSTQRAIAIFLDRETAKIDALIAKQNEFLTQLDEHRRALVTEALTQGLDPSVPMRETGVATFPRLPANWRFGRAKHSVSFITSGPRGWSDLMSDSGDIFFQSQNIGYSMEPLFEAPKRITAPMGSDADRARLHMDDVTVCITGARTSSVAHISTLPESAYINQHVCLLRPKPSIINGRFLAYCLWSSPCQNQFSVASYGLKQGLGLQDVGDIEIPIPDILIQSRIVEFLDRRWRQIDQIKQKCIFVSEILRERRSALITAAVTGQIDVTDAALRKAAA